MERESQSGKVCLHLHPGREQSWRPSGSGDPLAEQCMVSVLYSLSAQGPSQPFGSATIVLATPDPFPLGRTAPSASVLQMCTLSLLKGVDLLTTLHLALKCPSFGLSVGTGCSLIQSLSTAVNAQLRWWGGSEVFGNFTAVHTQNLCSPHTHAMGREVPWNQRPQGGWHLLPSVPAKLKQFFFSERKKNPAHYDLVVHSRIYVGQAYETTKFLLPVDKIYQHVLKQMFYLLMYLIQVPVNNQLFEYYPGILATWKLRLLELSRQQRYNH